MNILIVANHYAVCSARYAADAFTRLGHTVKHVGPAMGRDIWGLSLPAQHEWKPDEYVILGHSTSSNDYRLSMESDGVSTFTPDLIVTMDSDTQILDRQRNAPSTVSMIVWGVDNHVRDYRRSYFDHYFLAHRKASVMPWEPPNAASFPPGKFTQKDITHLPCCYDPAWHTPSPLPWEERRYDVAILGMMYPHRMAAVQELQAAGLKVIWGCGAVYETYRVLHHNSRIALNLSIAGDLGLRVFETAAMGCLVMSDLCPDLELLKPDGLWLIEPDKSLVEQVQFVLGQPETAKAMITKSLAWVKPHTWDNRAKQIVDWVVSQHKPDDLTFDLPEALMDDH